MTNAYQSADQQSASQSPAAATGPAQPDNAVVPWARQTMIAHQPHVTSRVRQRVQDLPSWDPLPPGEILVHRPARDTGP
jgi:hypothetical protein